MENNNFLSKISRIKDIHKTYEQSKSLTDVLEAYQHMSTDYNDFINEEHEFVYSDKNFYNCNKEEQESFLNSLKTFDCLITNNIKLTEGNTHDWVYIWNLLHDSVYAQTEKTKRKVVFSAASNHRPIGENAFNTWNGLQIIDLDIKDEALTNNLKGVLFNELNRHNWFLGICKSASGKGLHIWTKINPISIKYEHRKMEYFTNFRHKYSYVYFALYKYAKQFNYTENKILDFMDMAMSKPQQGIFISSDNNALLNMNFIDLRLDINFENYINSGVESIDWINFPALKSVFAKLEWFAEDTFTQTDINIDNIENTDDIDFNKNTPKHYKHNQRWQIANTLTNIYGPDKALMYIIKICLGTPKAELLGDIKTASIHNKPVSIWAVKELNKSHGFNIKIKDEKIDEIVNEAVSKIEIKTENDTDTIDPQSVFSNNDEKIEFFIKSNEYCGTIRDKILSNFSHITLLEAGAGYGKTEMFKQIPGARILLILPFTSTIKAKIEKSEVTEDWLYYYGNKRPTLDELLGTKSMSMTIDKFSRINLIELDSANFDYIVMDESHLLFTSSYRSVMSPCIQRIANCKSKIVLMSGTPTGERLFFPSIKHIKITKEETRSKKFNVIYCEGPLETRVKLCQAIAEDIYKGKKVLFPTNRGTLYYQQMVGLIERFLGEKDDYRGTLKAFYYKKSNYGDEDMDNINFNKNVGENNIIFCTTYLSVGVDIEDTENEYSVYFSDLYMCQDIDQFANRLRRKDLNINLYLNTKNSNGDPINYDTNNKLELGFDPLELMYIRDITLTANEMITRNSEDGKINPLVRSIIGRNQYIKYDENECKYFVDETAYKLTVFEDRWARFAEQIMILIKCMRYYGYEVNIIKYLGDNYIIPEATLADAEALITNCRLQKWDEDSKQTFDFLDKVNDGNIDMYKEIQGGNYALFKDDEYKEERGENMLYTESLEILEKNLPYVLALYKFYDIDTIKDIYRYCMSKKTHKINYAHLNRIRQFVNLEINITNKRLDFPIYKYTLDARRFAEEHSSTTVGEVTEFIQNYATKYVNSITDVTVDDNKYYQEMIDILADLWDVIIITKGKKTSDLNSKIDITPFTLLWEKKESLSNIFGNKNTETFFLQDLIEKPKQRLSIDEYVQLPEFEHTSKTTFKDIEYELKNDIVHKSWDYYQYSIEDGSNDRFNRKQHNTNRLNNIFDDVTSSTTNTTTQIDLFNQN